MLNRLLCCVGPVKGGTTWLMWHLRHSEEVFFAPEKEIHYHYGRAFWPDGISGRARVLQLVAKLSGRNWVWPQSQLSPGHRARVTADYAGRFSRESAKDADSLPAAMDRFRANMSWYQDYMAEPVDQSWYSHLYGGAGNKWPCDFSTTTCMVGPTGFQALKRCAEDVRIIFFIRNPYDRLWSHAKSLAVSQGIWRDFLEMAPKGRAKFIKRYKLHRHSLYSKRIKAMRKAVGPSNVLVLNFDDIERAPEKLLSMVSEFLGIAPVPIVEDLRARHASSPDLPVDWEAMAPFMKSFDAEIARLDAMGFGAVKLWYRDQST